MERIMCLRATAMPCFAPGRPCSLILPRNCALRPSVSRNAGCISRAAAAMRFSGDSASAAAAADSSEVEYEGFDENDFESLSEEEDSESGDQELEEEEVEPDLQLLDVKPPGRGKRQRRGANVTESQVPDHLLPRVAIVGRPNVGKSAVFNRIAGKKMAIVHDEPGVTRDRLYARAHWCGQDFMLIDTGGVFTLPSSGSAGTDGLAITQGGGTDGVAQATREAIAAGLPSLIEKQAASAVEEASALIFVVDGQAGATAVDIDLADWLRRKYSHKKITLAVNKCESPKKGLLQAADFWCLGFTPVPVSAISNFGVAELLSTVCSDLKAQQEEMEAESTADRPLALAIIGRPNVGKSSILNALVGEERTIVSPISGTTRDAIDINVTGPEGKVFRLIDTAGIRRRAAIASGGSKTEHLCVGSALKAIARSDVVALVIDAMECATEQDYRLGERIEKDGKACIIVVNKWDTVPEKNGESTFWYERDVREKLRVLKWAPIVYTSATSGQRIHKILEAALQAGRQRERRVPTAVVNQMLQEATSLKQPPTTRGGKKGRIYFCTQAATRPPTFVFFVNDETLFPDVYKRYMEKSIRQNIGFPGTPVRLYWRSKKLPKESKPGAKAGASSKAKKAEPAAVA